MAASTPLDALDFEQVRRIPLFDAVPEMTLQPLTNEAVVTAYRANTLLFSQGDPADRFFVVLSGRVRLYTLTSQGQETVIEFIEAGQSFAEGALFGSGRLPVNAEAMAGTRLVQIPARPILARIASDPVFARTIMDSLARWQRLLIGRLTGFKVRSPGQRLAAALLARATATHGPATVRLDVTKAGLAGHIGITPESLSRALARLSSVGVTVRGSEIFIADVGDLRRFAEDDNAT